MRFVESLLTTLIISSFVSDISNEMNVFIFNLSDEIFMETIIYLQNFGLDYFEVIRNNLEKFDEALLEVRQS